MAKKTKKKETPEGRISREVRALEQRLAAAEGLMRFQHQVQTESLAKAEKLRKLVLAAMKQRRNARLVRSWIRANDALEAFVKTLQPFHAPKGRDPFREKHARPLAEKIARHLFIDCAGNLARRLVAERAGERLERTGWSHKAMADRIEDLLAGEVE